MEDQTHQLSQVLGEDLDSVQVRVVSGSNRGASVELTSEFPCLIGTSPEATLPLTDRAVSRLHLELTLADGRVRARDLNSTNGSFVDGRRIDAVDVLPGSIMRVGETELEVVAQDAQSRLPPSEATAFGGLRGRSHRMRVVFTLLERAARTDATVLITGETGTGKEVAAEAIHRNSRRRDGPFVVVDCASIPANLIESDLFGHVKGAFTHAQSDRTGAFVEADGGTVFLDELGELPLELQPRLLRVLETQQVKPVGSNLFRKTDVRVVAATNRSLEDDVRAQKFRSDLYFRLAVVRVRLPALRERREDVPLLVRHFTEQLGAELKLEKGVMAQLMGHSWPGNVRELRNVVHQAATVSSTSLALALRMRRSDDEVPADASGPVPWEAFFSLPFREARKHATDAFELAYIKNAVAEAGGNVSKAAERVGLHRNMVHRILARDPDRT